MNEILLYFTTKYFGEWDKVYKALETKEEIVFEKMKQYAKEQKNNYVTILDDEYPRKLKEVDKPPFVIFFKGNKELMNEESYWPIQALRKYDSKLVSSEFKKKQRYMDIHRYWKEMFSKILQVEKYLWKMEGLKIN